MARRNPLLPSSPGPAQLPKRDAPVSVSPPVTLDEYPPLDLIAAKSTDDMQAGVGSVVAAVIAPKEGPINVTAGTPVVLIAKRLWDSPAVKRLRNAIIGAWSAFLTYVIGFVLYKGGPFALTEAAWIALLKDATYPALVSLALAYGIHQKVKDNDPVVDGSNAAGPTTLTR